MNGKDLHEVGEVIYWLASVRADLEALALIQQNPLGLSPDAVATACLGRLLMAEQAIERVALGVHRKKAR